MATGSDDHPVRKGEISRDPKGGKGERYGANRRMCIRKNIPLSGAKRSKRQDQR